MAKEVKAIWTPDGAHQIGESTAERVELRPGVMEWLRQFADVAAALKLGLHCAKCKKDLIGRNADNDKSFTVLCECRQFVAENRDFRAPVQH